MEDRQERKCGGPSRSPKPAALLLPLVLVVLLTVPLAAQQSITVAAASDLSFALPELARRFEQQSGNKVRQVLGSSGNLLAQIQNGAPYDVFLSANVLYPKQLIESGHAVAGSYASYAVGRLALLAPAESPLNLDELGSDALTAPSVRRIAIANPAHAPYGVAAVAALQHFGIYDQVKGKLVLGENVSQAAQFVVSGNAQIALTALSVAQAQGGRFALVHSEAHPRIEQAAVVLRQSRHRQAAGAFVEFLSTPAAQEILRRYGFETAFLESMQSRPEVLARKGTGLGR